MGVLCDTIVAVTREDPCFYYTLIIDYERNLLLSNETILNDHNHFSSLYCFKIPYVKLKSLLLVFKI